MYVKLRYTSDPLNWKHSTYPANNSKQIIPHVQKHNQIYFSGVELKRYIHRK